MRKPGRPAGSSAGDTRTALIAAARELFAQRGFGGTSVRSIASAAGVDASLINHHFGSKQGLLVATLELPVNPIEIITQVVAEGRDGFGDRLIRAFLDTWDPHRDVFAAMVRTAIADPEHAPAIEIARTVLVGQFSQITAGHELAASAIASQIIGLATIRYVARLEPMASASAEEVVRVYGPAIQAAVLSVV